MADKLYAVTAGTYSDYHIVSLCSDKARAKQICDIYNSGNTNYYGSASVEEFDDGIRADLTQPVFKITLHKDGELKNVLECNGGEKIDVLLAPNCSWRLRVTEQWNGDYLTHVVAGNVDTAIKIARDRLAQYKAKCEGIT
jgi:hypothetical protein